jgi:hypothetical protein
MPPPCPPLLRQPPRRPSQSELSFCCSAHCRLLPACRSLGKSTPSATTQVEREHQQDQHAVEVRYQLGCWGCVVAVIDSVDGSVTETVIFLKLSDALLAVLAPKAEASYQESATNHIRSKAHSTSYFNGMTDWDTKSLGIPGISCVREFRFATEPPTLDPDELKDRLSILHFARTDPGSVAYKTRQEEGRLLTRQYLVGEDKSKLKRKITDLYYRGQIATADDLKNAIANFWSFSSWAFVDFVTSPPSIWITLEELFFLLNSPAGHVWTGQHKNLPHVFLHLFLSVQHMLGPFIALGNCLKYRQAVIDCQPVTVTTYKEASAFALLQVHKINNIIHDGDLGVFREPPPIMRVFYPDASDPSAVKHGNSTSSNNDRDPDSSTPGLTGPVPRKTGGTKPSDSEDQQKRREQGVMKFAKQGKPPVPQTLFPHPMTAKMIYICGNASTVGFLFPRTIMTAILSTCTSRRICLWPTAPY